MKTPTTLPRHRLVRFAPWCLVLLGWAVSVFAGGTGLRYAGRVAAKDSGEPTDKVLGSTRADADGHFIVVQTEATDRPIALVASAVRESADSSGDRRQEGYDIKSHLTRLGVLFNPSPTKPNTVLVERRQPGR